MKYGRADIRGLVYDGWAICLLLAGTIAIGIWRIDDSPHMPILIGVMLFAFGVVIGMNLMHYRWLKVWGFGDRQP